MLLLRVFFAIRFGDFAGGAGGVVKGESAGKAISNGQTGRHHGVMVGSIGVSCSVWSTIP